MGRPEQKPGAVEGKTSAAQERMYREDEQRVELAAAGSRISLLCLQVWMRML